MSNENEPLSGETFPPLAGTLASVRKNYLTTCVFLKLRKASTENPNYVNPDGTSLMTYSETLNLDREEARKRVLEYEIGKGWVVDDRGTAVPNSPVAQPVAPNGAPMTAGFVQAPVPQPAPVQQVIQAPMPQQIATPAQAVAVAQMTPTAPPQMAAPTEMPTTKARRAAPKLGASVAPFPPPPTNGAAPAAFQAPQPPPGAAVVQAPVAFIVPQPVAATVPQPMATTTFTQAPQQAPQAPVSVPSVQEVPKTALGPLVDLGPITARLDELGRGLTSVSSQLDTQGSDFKTMVSNLSASLNETNKTLANLQKTTEFLMVAMHHLYLTNETTAKMSAGKAADIRAFKTFLTTYLDPAGNPQ